MIKITNRYKERLLISFSELVNKNSTFINDFMYKDFKEKDFLSNINPIDLIHLKMIKYKEEQKIDKAKDIDINKFIEFILSDVKAYSKDLENNDELYNYFTIPIQCILIYNILDITENEVDCINSFIYNDLKIYLHSNIFPKANILECTPSNSYIHYVKITLAGYINKPDGINHQFINSTIADQEKLLLDTISLVKSRIQNTSQPKQLSSKLKIQIENSDVDEIIELENRITELFSNNVRKSKFKKSTLYNVIKVSDITEVTYNSKTYLTLADLNNGLFRGYKYHLIIKALKKYEIDISETLAKKDILIDTLKKDIEILNSYNHDDDVKILNVIIKLYKYKNYSHLLPVVYLSIYLTITYDDMYKLSRNFFGNTNTKASAIKIFKEIKELIQTNNLY